MVVLLSIAFVSFVLFVVSLSAPILPAFLAYDLNILSQFPGRCGHRPYTAELRPDTARCVAAAVHSGFFPFPSSLPMTWTFCPSYPSVSSRRSRAAG
jgi:hypothetical protein